MEMEAPFDGLLVTQKTLREIAPPKISPSGACTWKIALKYNVKESKNG